LADQTTFAQKIAGPENGNDRLSTSAGGYGNFYTAFLNIENVIGRLTLGEEFLPLAEFHPFLGYAGRIEKGEYLGGNRGFDFRGSTFELRASGLNASTFAS
jgi:hypothetical protein